MSKATAKKVTTQPGTARETEALDLPPRRRLKPLVFQIRMDQPTLDRLEELAERKGVPASTLARMWLLERMAQERKVLDPPSKYSEWV